MSRLFSLTSVLAIGSVIAATCGPAFAQAYLPELLDRPAYRKSWNALFTGEKNLAPWLARYAKTKNGPAMPGVPIDLGTARYQLNTVCKTHDCWNNRFAVLFAPEGTRAWGLLLRNGQEERFFGHPDEEKKAALRAAMREG